MNLDDELRRRRERIRDLDGREASEAWRRIARRRVSPDVERMFMDGISRRLDRINPTAAEEDQAREQAVYDDAAAILDALEGASRAQEAQQLIDLWESDL